MEDRAAGKTIKTETRKRTPPHRLKIEKGSAYGTFSREFVRFVLEDSVSQVLIEWSRDTLTPDEHVWTTLNQLNVNPHLRTPGGSKGEVLLNAVT